MGAGPAATGGATASGGPATGAGGATASGGRVDETARAAKLRPEPRWSIVDEAVVLLLAVGEATAVGTVKEVVQVLGSLLLLLLLLFGLSSLLLLFGLSWLSWLLLLFGGLSSSLLLLLGTGALPEASVVDDASMAGRRFILGGGGGGGDDCVPNWTKPTEWQRYQRLKDEEESLDCWDGAWLLSLVVDEASSGPAWVGGGMAWKRGVDDGTEEIELVATALSKNVVGSGRL